MTAVWSYGGYYTYGKADRERIPSLFAWRSRAREEFEVKDRLSGGDCYAVVLEFEFLSRIIASTQSMKHCRHKPRPLRQSDHKVIGQRKTRQLCAFNKIGLGISEAVDERSRAAPNSTTFKAVSLRATTPHPSCFA
jgi:hypothetical protein